MTAKNILVVAADEQRRAEIAASLRRAGFDACELPTDAGCVSESIARGHADAVVIGDDDSVASFHTYRERIGGPASACPTVRVPSMTSSSWEYELLCLLEAVL